jgi:trans-aconitate 2-methyltransferase
VADLRTWRAPDPLDLVVSNATLHWVPDHAAALAGLVGQLAAGGVLAFQVPNNFGEPSHLALDELLRREPWCHRCAAMPRPGVEQPAWYLEKLGALGLDADVWETTYLHLLPDPEAILEWMTGTTLRPVLARLDDGEQERFRGELLEMLREAYPQSSCGTVFPFRRIFVIGRRR